MAKATKKRSGDSTADNLRNNTDAAGYRHVVLGLVFLKYISDAFEVMCAGRALGKYRPGDLIGTIAFPPFAGGGATNRAGAGGVAVGNAGDGMSTELMT